MSLHGNSARRSVTLGSLVVVLVLCAVACGGGAGSALATPNGHFLNGFGPIPPGQEVESLDVDLWNTSNVEVRMLSIQVDGQGVGTVGRIVRMEVGSAPALVDS
ncbi:MAG TPA: hypothetical protein VMU14_18510 [Acidimicrobiales bacterium]|nr:hypothetical protein [Acidimicrobiales bacterium]